MAGEETILLTRVTDVHVNDLIPGQYVPYARHDSYGGTAWAGWRCPRCRKSLLLLRSVHTVNYEGDVTPRVGCPSEDCGLVGHFQLADWVPEALGHA